MAKMICPADPVLERVNTILEPYKDACIEMMYRHPALVVPFPEDIKRATDTYRQVADKYVKGMVEYWATRPVSVYTCPKTIVEVDNYGAAH